MTGILGTLQSMMSKLVCALGLSGQPLVVASGTMLTLVTIASPVDQFVTTATVTLVQV